MLSFQPFTPADMDVRCSRCSTEYEFDDALISERGTTVKCTNCGFQFKIFPGTAELGVPERWVVRTHAGRELVYTSLRDLQRGIAEKKVGPDDLLSRGKQPPRLLGSIAELEPFFRNSVESAHTQSTLHGLAPPAQRFGDGPRPTSATPAENARPTQTSASAPFVETPRAPASSGGDVPPAPTEFGEGQAGEEQAGAPPRAQEQLNFDALERALTPRAPVSSPRHVPTSALGNMRESFASYDELSIDSAPDYSHARRARSRWIAGVVLIGVAGLLAATVGRRYLAQLVGVSEVKTSSDERVAKFLNDGSALLDEGDFEGAKEQFDKATALAEKDPAVLTALARLETLRADVPWLKLRLLDPRSLDLVQATRRELGRRVGKARTAVDRAFAVSPEDLGVLRARIDVLRLSGDGDKAREWIAPLSESSSVPENAYVLAALDLAEPSPIWPSVIDRLRTAVSAERDPGRAHAALIYALASAGRLSEAQAEFGKIDNRVKPHPLLEELRAFLQRERGATDAGADAAAKLSAAPEPTLSPKPDSPSNGEGEPHPGPAAFSGDFQTRLAQASIALRQGDLARADQLYSSVLGDQPYNTEAMSGLASVAELRHDPVGASQLYDRVLAQNPNYLPALLASAEQKWAAGERASALILYRRVLDQAGPTSVYSARAKARIAEAEAEDASTENSKVAPPTPVPPSANKAPDNSDPNGDR